MSHKKLSAFGIFATSRAALNATDALVKQGFPASDITVRPPGSADREAGAAILLTLQGNTAVEIELATKIIGRSGAADVSFTGESAIATRRMERPTVTERVL